MGITPISDAIAMCFNSLRSHLKFSYEKNNNNTKMGVPGPLYKQYIVPSLIRYRLMNLVFIVFFLFDLIFYVAVNNFSVISGRVFLC